MPQQDERVSKFAAAITKEAEEKRSAIEQETQHFVESELEKAEMEALSESYQMIQKAGANIRSDAGSRVSAGKIESRKKLLLRREAIIGEVLDGVSERVKAYVQTPDYGTFLQKSLTDGAELFEGAFIVYLRPDDASFEEALRSSCDRCKIEQDTSIRLGGLKFSDANRFRYADDTLDVRLKDGRQWFMKNSGITIR